jgi:hypothetical protein
VGPAIGGTLLTLTGQFPSGTTVRINGVAATEQHPLSPSVLTVRSPGLPAAFGQAVLELEEPEGQRIRRDDLFSYAADQLCSLRRRWPILCRRSPWALSSFARAVAASRS